MAFSTPTSEKHGFQKSRIGFQPSKISVHPFTERRMPKNDVFQHAAGPRAGPGYRNLPVSPAPAGRAGESPPCFRTAFDGFTRSRFLSNSSLPGPDGSRKHLRKQKPAGDPPRARQRPYMRKYYDRSRLRPIRRSIMVAREANPRNWPG